MNLFDIVILVIIGFCLIRGGFRGLIKEVAAIVGVLGGFYGAYRYYQILGGILSKWISTDAYSGPSSPRSWPLLEYFDSNFLAILSVKSGD